MTTTPKRAALYLRLSVDKEASSSIERQREECRRYAEGKGYTIVAEAEDRDISGGVAPQDRPGFATLLGRGDVDVIVFASLDRLARSVVGFHVTAEALKERGVSVASVKEDLDLSTPVGRFVATILAAFAQMERETIADRVTRSIRHRKARGLWTGGQVPYGYVAVRVNGEMTLQIDDDQASVVREMAERVLDGQSVNSIVTDLNRRGVPTVKGGPWLGTTLTQVLTNDPIAGRLTRGGKPVVGDDGKIVQAFPPIIEAEQLARLREVLWANKGNGRGQGKRRAARLLSGVLRCGGCGGPMYVKRRGASDGGGAVYACGQARGGVCTAPRSIDADKADAYVEGLFLEHLGQREVFEKVVSGGEPEGLAALRDEIALAAASVAEDASTDAVARLRALQDARRALESQPVTREVTWQPTGRLFVDEWREADLDKRRGMLRDSLGATVEPGRAAASKRIKVLWKFRDDREWLGETPFDPDTLTEDDLWAEEL